MFNQSLDRLATLITGPSPAPRAEFESLLRRHLDEAVGSVVSNDYVEDCLDLITPSLDRLFAANDSERNIARLHILGAIEALRDELALCEQQIMPSLRAAGR